MHDPRAGAAKRSVPVRPRLRALRHDDAAGDARLAPPARGPAGVVLRRARAPAGRRYEADGRVDPDDARRRAREATGPSREWQIAPRSAPLRWRATRPATSPPRSPSSTAATPSSGASPRRGQDAGPRPPRRAARRGVPRARFLHIVRDGRDVVPSLLEMHFGPDRFGAAVLFWEKRVARGRRAGVVSDRAATARSATRTSSPTPSRCCATSARSSTWSSRPRCSSTTSAPTRCSTGCASPPPRPGDPPAADDGLRDWRRTHAATRGAALRGARRRPARRARLRAVRAARDRSGAGRGRGVADRATASSAAPGSCATRVTRRLPRSPRLRPGRRGGAEVGCASPSSATPGSSSRPSTARSSATRGSIRRSSRRGCRSPTTAGSTSTRSVRPTTSTSRHSHDDHLDARFLAEHVRQGRGRDPPGLPDRRPPARARGPRASTEFVETRNDEPLDLDGLRILTNALVAPTDGAIGDSGLAVADGTATVFNQNDSKPIDFDALVALRSVRRAPRAVLRRDLVPDGRTGSRARRSRRSAGASGPTSSRAPRGWSRRSTRPSSSRSPGRRASSTRSCSTSTTSAPTTRTSSWTSTPRSSTCAARGSTTASHRAGHRRRARRRSLHRHPSRRRTTR